MDPSAAPRPSRSHLAITLAIGGLSAALALSLDHSGPFLAGAVAAGAFVYGTRRGKEDALATARLDRFRIADELVQYRAFTRLMRDQGQRIAGLSGDAAMVIAAGLTEMDRRAAALAARVGALPPGHPVPEGLTAELEVISEPIVEMLGKLQFQDVTQQQLTFLARLSLLLDEHIGEMVRRLGDRRSLDRTTRFKEMFDRALDDTVMTSQRNDHHMATGLDLFENAGPTVDIFQEENRP